MRARMNRLMTISSFLIVGISLGWLTGLSASPAIAAVLGATVGCAAGLLSIRADQRQFMSLDAPLLAALCLGLSLGAPLGIFARSHRLLAPEYQSASSVPAKATDHDLFAAVLFSKGTTECARLLGSPRSDLRSALLTSQLPWAAPLAKRAIDDASLETVVEVLCGPSQEH
jgi:hypothetical protein